MTNEGLMPNYVDIIKSSPNPLSVSSTNFLQCIKLPALREVVLMVGYDKDADQQDVDLPNDVITALSELIHYSHCSLIRLCR